MGYAAKYYQRTDNCRTTFQKARERDDMTKDEILAELRRSTMDFNSMVLQLNAIGASMNMVMASVGQLGTKINTCIAALEALPPDTATKNEIGGTLHILPRKDLN
jgi:hypothetical protein